MNFKTNIVTFFAILFWFSIWGVTSNCGGDGETSSAVEIIDVDLSLRFATPTSSMEKELITKETRFVSLAIQGTGFPLIEQEVFREILDSDANDSFIISDIPIPAGINRRIYVFLRDNEHIEIARGSQVLASLDGDRKEPVQIDIEPAYVNIEGSFLVFDYHLLGTNLTFKMEISSPDGTNQTQKTLKVPTAQGDPIEYLSLSGGRYPFNITTLGGRSRTFSVILQESVDNISIGQGRLSNLALGPSSIYDLAIPIQLKSGEIQISNVSVDSPGSSSSQYFFTISLNRIDPITSEESEEISVFLTESEIPYKIPRLPSGDYTYSALAHLYDFSTSPDPDIEQTLIASQSGQFTIFPGKTTQIDNLILEQQDF